MNRCYNVCRNLKTRSNNLPDRNEALMKTIILLLNLLVPISVVAQNYSINWYTVSGGGGTSTGGPHSLSGSVGQSAAGGPLTGGSYSTYGGFWAIDAVQTPGLPLLTITHAGNSIIVSWPNTGSYTLQQNSNLAATAGWTTSTYPITTGATNSITITQPAGNLFFRLAP